MDMQELFDRVSGRVSAAHPADGQGRMLSAPSLTTSGRSYAFATADDLIVKLPAARVAALIADGTGRPCAPGGRAPMREWVVLRPADEDACAAYVLEARGFTAGGAA